MPLVHITLRRGKSDAYIQSVADGIHAAMVATINAPQVDRFQIVTEQEPGRLIADPTYLGIARTEDVIIVEITLAAGRTDAQKQGLYRRITANLADDPRVRSEDVMIVLRENGLNDWSFGNGDAPFAGRSYQEIRGGAG